MIKKMSVFFLTGLIFITAVSAAAINIKIDFSGETLPVIPDDGWKTENGVLKTKSSTGEKYVWGDVSTADWTDYGYQMDVTFIDAVSDEYQLNMFIRESGEGRNYMAALRTTEWKHSPTGNFIDIYQSGTGDSSVYLTPFAGFEKGKKYTVRFEATGNKQIIHVDSVKILEVTDTSSKHKSGRFGWSALNCSVEIDNLHIFDAANAPKSKEPPKASSTPPPVSSEPAPAVSSQAASSAPPVSVSSQPAAQSNDTASQPSGGLITLSPAPGSTSSPGNSGTVQTVSEGFSSAVWLYLIGGGVLLLVTAGTAIYTAIVLTKRKKEV